MFTKYFKIVLRSLWKDRTYSFINIVGLSVGLASTFVILLYSIHESSYDRYNKKLDRIYVLTMGSPFMDVTQPQSPFPAGPTLKDEYPEVKAFARCYQSVCSVMRYKDEHKGFLKIDCVSADSTIFRILTLPIISGRLVDVYTQRNSAVISRDLGERLFGDGDPVGQLITVNWSGELYDFKIAAVMANIPSTSTFKADCILPIFPAEQSLSETWKDYAHSPEEHAPLDSWEVGFVRTYLLLWNQESAVHLSTELTRFCEDRSKYGWPLRLHLFPLKDLYFHSSKLVNVRYPRGNLTDVRVYSAISLLTLLIACVNFVLLATGRATIRTKEIGVRKVVGASRIEIAKQVTIESLMVYVLSLPGALLLVEVFTPSFSQLLGKSLRADYYHSGYSIILYIAVTVVAGILSGSYVSFYLSGFQPASILRNKFIVGQTKVAFRRILIALQMIIFVGLIMASITIYRQMRYFHDKNMGFDTKNLLVFSGYGEESNDSTGDRFQALKQEINDIPDVQAVSGGNFVPGTQSYSASTVPNESNPQETVTYQTFSVDRDFFYALRTKIVLGRTFAEVPLNDAKNAVVMNQAAVKAIGITNPLQQLFNGHRILGVVKDFNMHSLHEKIAPTVFWDEPQRVREIVVRLRHLRDVPQTIASIEKVLERFDGGKRLDYQFFNNRLSDMYTSDYKFADMIGYFTGLAIFVACLGLFGMSLFIIQRHLKEIGVRKVFGASVICILISVLKEYFALQLISTVIALPVSVFFTEEWLRDFAYHVNVNLFSVLAALLVGLLIVLFTVGYQSLKAATNSPMESLRYE